MRYREIITEKNHDGVEVTNRLYRKGIAAGEFRHGGVLPKYGQRNITNVEEIEAIIRDGFMLPRAGKKSKYFTMTDEENPPLGNQGGYTIRVKSENIPDGRPVRAEHVEIWDNSVKSWKPLTEQQQNEGAKSRKSKKRKSKKRKPKAKTYGIGYGYGYWGWGDHQSGSEGGGDVGGGDGGGGGE